MYFVTFYCTDGINLDTYFDIRHVGPFKSYVAAHLYIKRIRERHPKLVMKDSGGYGTIIDTLHSATFEWADEYERPLAPKARRA